ncbi:MAG: YkgJ family cysteine cluster protein [Bryobacteraceae bacterium]
MLTDLVQIRRLGEKKLPENERFRKYLKTHNFVERRLKKLGQEVEAQIDCTECANCCKVATTRLAERDIEKLSWSLRIKRAEFIRDYTDISHDEGVILKRTKDGCVFLDGKQCTVYEVRPHICEDFPHVVKGDGSFLARMWDLKDRPAIVPSCLIRSKRSRQK